MSLEIYSKYYDADHDQTVVSVSETDSARFVRFDAAFSGNLIGESSPQLLDRAIAWFTNRYIQEYAQQKLDERVRQFDKMIAQMQETSGTAQASILELITLLYGKGALSDEDFAALSDSL